MNTIFIALVIAVVLFGLYKSSGPLIDWVGRNFADPAPPATLEGLIDFRNIEYRQTPQGPLLLDVYLPESPSRTPRPVLIHIFGGGWKMGNKDVVEMMKGLYYAQQGYAVVTISYRLSDVATFPAQIRDCKAAVRWVRKNAEQYNFDSNRAGAAGYLLKDTQPAQLLASIKGTTASETFLDPAIAGKVLQRAIQPAYHQSQPAQLVELLTPHELELLALVVKGRNNRQIG